MGWGGFTSPTSPSPTSTIRSTSYSPREVEPSKTTKHLRGGVPPLWDTNVHRHSSSGWFKMGSGWSPAGRRSKKADRSTTQVPSPKFNSSSTPSRPDGTTSSRVCSGSTISTGSSWGRENPSQERDHLPSGYHNNSYNCSGLGDASKRPARQPPEAIDGRG